MRASTSLLLLLLGCSHSDAFGNDPPVPLTVPFGNGHPTQLTLSLQDDAEASWSPDGRSIFWSAQKVLEFDRCVSVVPSTGGTLTNLQCPPNGDAFLSVLMTPASDGTELAWALNQSSLLSPFAVHQFTIYLAGLRPGAPAHAVLNFPYVAPSGRSHDLPLYLQWLKPGVLLYLGAEMAGCCAVDTLRFGEQVVTLDLTGPTPVKTFVPGTTRASAVSASEDGNSIYYTFPGDSVVYQQVLAGGSVTELHNFGAGHIVRDPTVSGQVLVGIVDGRPKTQNLPPFGVVNVDFGGEIAVVDLTSGQETRVRQGEHWYRRPRLAPGGGRFTVESFPYVVIPHLQPEPPETLVTLTNDIWLWEE